MAEDTRKVRCPVCNSTKIKSSIEGAKAIFICLSCGNAF
jgi:transposase-like protein